MKRSNRFLTNILPGLAVMAALVFGACSDNSTGPTPPTQSDPPGSSSTIKISDPVDPSEAAAVRSNAQKHANDSFAIDIDQAIAIALAQTGGELLGVNVDYDSDAVNYEVIVRSMGRIYLVVINPQTGAVVDKDEVSNAYYTTIIVVRTITIKIKEARERARQVVNGDVVECNIEQIDGRPTYIIVIIDNSNRYVTVYVDCETGKDRKLEDDGRCDEERHKNKRGRGHYRHGKGHGYGHHYHCHCHCDDDHGGGDTTNVGDSTNVRDSVITADSAKAIAQSLIDSSTATDANLDIQNDSTASYTVKVERDSNTYEVRLDAFTGALQEIEQTAGDMYGDYQPDVPHDTLVSLSTARTAALAQLAGDVWRWKLEKDSTDDQWVYVFEIMPTGGSSTQHVFVDAKTGAYKRTE